MYKWAGGLDDEKRFITHVLAFFAASDGIVMENLAMRFMNGALPFLKGLTTLLSLNFVFQKLCLETGTTVSGKDGAAFGATQCISFT